MNTVITIGRQYGSDGRAIGEALAKEFKIPFYDKEILARASKESGMCEEIFQENDEKKTSSFLFSLVMDSSFFGFGSSYSPGGFDMPIQQKIFLAQFETIKNIAEEGPCVIVGRCADYVLDDFDNVVNVFVHADIETRCRIVEKRDGLSEKDALEAVVRNDKERLSYYNYYTNNDWGDANNYNLTVDSGMLGLEGSVAVIKNFVEIAEKKRNGF